MKVTSDFEYSLKEKLYRLCNRENYFTCGSNRQYDRMFTISTDPKFSVREVAILIFMCSDDGADLDTIEKQVQEIYDDILEYETAVRMEEQIAQGERAADEVYCGYYD